MQGAALSKEEIQQATSPHHHPPQSMHHAPSLRSATSRGARATRTRACEAKGEILLIEMRAAAIALLVKRGAKGTFFDVMLCHAVFVLTINIAFV